MATPGHEAPTAAEHEPDVQLVLTIRDGATEDTCLVEVYLREGMPATDFTGWLRSLIDQWEDGSAKRLA